jgi:hypothetical protein
MDKSGPMPVARLLCETFPAEEPNFERYKFLRGYALIGATQNPP